jgi:hypothetical protein
LKAHILPLSVSPRFDTARSEWSLVAVVPAAELAQPLQRTLVLEAILAFPEFDAAGANVEPSVLPSFCVEE